MSGPDEALVSTINMAAPATGKKKAAKT